MYIPSRPYTRATGKIGEFKSRFHGDPFFFRRGVDALAFGLRRLVPKGSGIVLPAFYCSYVSRYLTELGYELHWLDIRADLTYDLPRLNRLLDEENRIRAILVCDYFGRADPQAQKIADTARLRSLISIKDSCHSPLSNYSMSDFDMVIFSFRKTVPVWDGGVLVFKENKIRHAAFLPEFNWRDVVRQVKSVIEGGLAKSAYINPYPYLDRLDSVDETVSLRIESEIQPSRSLRTWLSSDSALTEISLRRRLNYSFLECELNKIDLSPVFDLGQNDVPQVFPLKAKAAHFFVRYLRNNGIGAYQWPGEGAPDNLRDCPDKFPIASGMTESLICLPIHQDINIAQLKRIVQLVKKCQHIA